MALPGQLPAASFCNPCGRASPYELQLIHYGGYSGAPDAFWVSGWSIVDAGTVVPDESLFPFLFPGEVFPFRDTAVKVRAMLHAEYPNRGTESCSEFGDPVEFDIEEWDARFSYNEDDPSLANRKINCGACPADLSYCSSDISEESESINKIINAVGEFDWSLIPTWGKGSDPGSLTCLAYLYHNAETDTFDPTYSFIWTVGPPLNSANGYGSLAAPDTGRIPFGLMQFITGSIGESNQLVPPYDQLGNPPFVGFRFWVARPRIRMLSPGFCRLVTVDAEGNYTTVLEDLLPPRVYQTGEIVEPTWDSARFIEAGLPSCLLLVELGTDECL